MRTDVQPLIRALRTSLTETGFLEFAHRASEQGLVFTGVYDEYSRCVAVATHRVLETSRGRLLFVDDLVTDPELRSHGVGGYLVDQLAERAREANCARLELDSGVVNNQAHRFYHARRMAVSAFHFALELEHGKSAS
ncbi:GNAT superfamily N-acetyltransferase [Actinopolyspora lacussalsi]|nr:GNAT superfamily N-acetyltransferase [Actinopolyspora lacussalsi]